jgi:putative hydrolase of the HAD superfamily
MPDVTALFWDIGGLILSNGWDRANASEKFGLDWEEFQDRHELASPAFETGLISLDTCLIRTIQFQSAEQLRADLASNGVSFAPQC